MTILTNILATLTVVISTNTYHPKQYWHESNIVLCGANQASYAQQSGSWENYPPFQWSTPFGTRQKERDNPDVRIIEVSEIKTLSFECDGKPYRLEHANTVMSSKRENRVISSETTQTNGLTITTTVERWVVQ